MDQIKRIFNFVIGQFKSCLLWLVKLKAIRHSSKLGGITGIEVAFQKAMHEFLTLCGVNSVMFQLFEIVAGSLYVMMCVYLFTQCGIDLYFELKKDYFNYQSNLFKSDLL